MNSEPRCHPPSYGQWRFEVSNDGNTLKLWHPKLSESYAFAAGGAPFPVGRESRWSTWWQFDNDSIFAPGVMYHVVQIYFACVWFD